MRRRPPNTTRPNPLLPHTTPFRARVRQAKRRAGENRMALGPRRDLRQSQSLVMTPQLQQAIRLLAASNLEIETFIAEALESNPLLEAESFGRDEAAEEIGRAHV